MVIILLLVVGCKDKFIEQTEGFDVSLRELANGEINEEYLVLVKEAGRLTTNDNSDPIYHIGNGNYKCNKFGGKAEIIQIFPNPEPFPPRLGLGSRKAYYCSSENVFYIFDIAGSLSPRLLYGPFEGYPNLEEINDLNLSYKMMSGINRAILYKLRMPQQLKNSNNNGLFTSGIHNINVGKKETLVYGFKNDLSSELSYSLNLSFYGSNNLEIKEPGFILEYDIGPQTLGANDIYVGEIDLTANSEIGRYGLKLEIRNSNDNSIYKSNYFFIDVNE
jgi:hypothetical protein